MYYLPWRREGALKSHLNRGRRRVELSASKSRGGRIAVAQASLLQVGHVKGVVLEVLPYLLQNAWAARATAGYGGGLVVGGRRDSRRWSTPDRTMRHKRAFALFLLKNDPTLNSICVNPSSLSSQKVIAILKGMS